jgi:5'-nucleotidase
VYLGIRQILKTEPDLVLSGINMGANLGTDIYYSGTVAAAREGALAGIKSYAFSLVDMRQIQKAEKRPMDFEMAARWAIRVVDSTMLLPFPDHSVLNVNIPNMEAGLIQGARAARQAIRYYGKEVLTNKDPRGRPYHWIGGLYEKFRGNGDSDCDWIAQGWVVATPVDIDATHNEFYATLKTVLPGRETTA